MKTVWMFGRLRHARSSRRHFVAYFHFTAWAHFSCGGHVDLSQPHIELHVPFGFLRVGWIKTLASPGRPVTFGCQQLFVDE